MPNETAEVFLRLSRSALALCRGSNQTQLHLRCLCHYDVAKRGRPGRPYERGSRACSPSSPNASAVGLRANQFLRLVDGHAEQGQSAAGSVHVVSVPGGSRSRPPLSECVQRGGAWGAMGQRIAEWRPTQTPPPFLCVGEGTGRSLGVGGGGA